MGDESGDEVTIHTRWVRDLFPIAMLLISGLVWGMKLEARYDRLEEKVLGNSEAIAQIRAELNKGMLPITAERLAVLQARIDKVEKDCTPRQQQ